jgi:mono/diheme cytochrome c family protein
VGQLQIHTVGSLLVALSLGCIGASAQTPSASSEVQEGRRLALLICSNCHVVARDQPFEPILRPPAPSFNSIARRSGISIDSVRAFLMSAHQDIGKPKGMPNPQLLDFQAQQVAAYLLDLRHKR